MTCLELTLPTPEENLACDEALLDLCEEDGAGEILRFWEPRDSFVVLGYGNRAAREVHLEACEAEKIPVLRRCTGGGTVLQGPGCLNYALILRIAERGPLHSIPATNAFILRRHRDALQTRLGDSVRVAGTTDLALIHSKFSGNAQRRRKHFLLFHGTFLVEFDLHRLERFLPLPSRQPDYRENRAHRDFVCNVAIDRPAIREVLRQAWEASEPCEDIPSSRIQTLVERKYSRREWNFRF